jgi:hypothetical protein
MTTSNTPKRASEFSKGIGGNLDTILGKDVTVVRTSIDQRNFDGELSTIVLIELEDGSLYHAWSDSLAQKIAEIPHDAYPLVFKFIRVPTRRPGQTVISFE